jgi:hypothetical protein
MHDYGYDCTCWECDPGADTRRKLEPIRTRSKPGETPEIEKKKERALEKALFSKNFDQMYSTALGLPSRARRYIKQIRKLEKSGKTWQDIGPKLASVASKILYDRVDVMIRVPLILKKLKKDGKELPDDERVQRATKRCVEFDALLTLTAPYLMPGATARIAKICLSYSDDGLGDQLGGLVDVVDYGALDDRQKASRRSIALEMLRKNKWALPE